MQTNIYLKEKNKYKNIPNFLTIVRIFLTPIILCFLFLAEKSEKFYSLNLSFKENEEYCSISFFHFFAGTLFVLGCLSDFLDGYLARKYKCDSNFGKL